MYKLAPQLRRGQGGRHGQQAHQAGPRDPNRGNHLDDRPNWQLPTLRPDCVPAALASGCRVGTANRSSVPAALSEFPDACSAAGPLLVGGAWFSLSERRAWVHPAVKLDDLVHQRARLGILAMTSEAKRVELAWARGQAAG